MGVLTEIEEYIFVFILVNSWALILGILDDHLRIFIRLELGLI